jgi:hypothetical protein
MRILLFTFDSEFALRLAHVSSFSGESYTVLRIHDNCPSSFFHLTRPLPRDLKWNRNMIQLSRLALMPTWASRMRLIKSSSTCTSVAWTFCVVHPHKENMKARRLDSHGRCVRKVVIQRTLTWKEGIGAVLPEPHAVANIKGYVLQ